MMPTGPARPCDPVTGTWPVNIMPIPMKMSVTMLARRPARVAEGADETQILVRDPGLHAKEAGAVRLLLAVSASVTCRPLRSTTIVTVCPG